jgi:transposase
VLLGRGVVAADINEDALGRALDKLATAEPKKVFAAICARAAVLESVDRRFLHWDSTSRSFYGDYDRPVSDGGVAVSCGHSKDHRPDLKQILLSVLGNREGFPLWGAVQAGNASDKTLNTEVIDQIREAFSPEEWRTLIHVADSAFVTGPNLAAAAEIKLRFISRLPETYAAAARVKARAWEGAWSDIGQVATRREAASYQASEQEEVIGGRPYRLVVLRSSQLEKRKAATFEKELAAQGDELAQTGNALGRQAFACQEDAETAAGAWLLQAGYHRLSARVDAEQVKLKRDRPGRPRKGEPVATRAVYRVATVIEGRDEAKVEAERQRRSTFVLITTVPQAEVGSRDLLLEYKFQGSLERRFAFLKDKEIVDSFFVKKTERVVALGYVLLIVCLIFSVLERRVRQTGKPLPTLARGPVKNPTGLEILRNTFATVLLADDGHRTLYVQDELRPTFDAILSGAGVDVGAYTTPPVRAPT